MRVRTRALSGSPHERAHQGVLCRIAIVVGVGPAVLVPVSVVAAVSLPATAHAPFPPGRSRRPVKLSSLAGAARAVPRVLVVESVTVIAFDQGTRVEQAVSDVRPGSSRAPRRHHHLPSRVGLTFGRVTSASAARPPNPDGGTAWGAGREHRRQRRKGADPTGQTRGHDTAESASPPRTEDNALFQGI